MVAEVDNEAHELTGIGNFFDREDRANANVDLLEERRRYRGFDGNRSSQGESPREWNAVVRELRGLINGHRPSNVKHQRARATESREDGTISLRALRCMR